MRDLHLGGVLVYFPPADLVAMSAAYYESAGMDFVLAGDQMNFEIPASIWTPDIVPAAEHGMGGDAWLDPFACCQTGAAATERIVTGLVCDGLRRTPSVLAQSILTADHMSRGRFFIALGAGEAKQFTPYGLERRKPFLHLEECVKIVRLLLRETEPVDYEGPVWTLRKALVGLGPYQPDQPPPVLVAGGPGRATDIAGKYADGWLTYVPPACDPETYASEVIKVKRLAEAAGRDPDELIFSIATMALVVRDEGELDELCAHPVIRWSAAATVPIGATWRRWGSVHPLGDDYAYPRDYIPMEWSRDAVLDVVAQVPPAVARQAKCSGTPEQVAEQLQAYVDAGCSHLAVGNYAALVASGDFADALGQTSLGFEVAQHLREWNGASAQG